MITAKTLCLYTLILIMGCNQVVDNSSADFENEINQLETFQDKKVYLEKIFEDDQNVRDGKKEAEVISRYGYGSNEHKALAEEQWAQDEINLQKIEAYLKKHGYPGKEMGELATTAPWVVIHHAQEYDTRERHFEIIYEAYLKGDIKDGSISLFLGRMYEMKNGERLKMEGSYKSEDQINLLIKELNLEDKKANVQQRI
jgi:thymidylate synthase